MAPELLALVTYHCRHITTYRARAQSQGTHNHACPSEWQRLTLYVDRGISSTP
ncbi:MULTISPECIES: hypothetical protein [unclassified Streptomyces]|uniref:hypothetical protein n=1 Tax=unclassified Streptomyces TaxID=2593676 RepID=UPI0036EECD25